MSKKTKYMLIGSRPKLDLVSNYFAVKVDNIPIESVTVYNSLEVSLDEDLTWKAHIEEISKKISAGLTVLNGLSPTIPLETMQIMYKALVLPYFDYSCCVWECVGIGFNLTEKLQQLQNRAARIVTLLNYETRSKDLLDDLGWEVLVDRRMRKLAVLMDKITHDISPPYLRNIFQNVSDVHSYDLRNSSINWSIPKPTLETGKHSLHYRGSVLWNKILVEARKQESLVLFKSLLKDILSEIK